MTEPNQQQGGYTTRNQELLRRSYSRINQSHNYSTRSIRDGKSNFPLPKTSLSTNRRRYCQLALNVALGQYLHVLLANRFGQVISRQE